MAKDNVYLFTSESVTEGHPDKMADQISDAILDAVMSKDPNGRVACETMVTTGLAMIAGEITTESYVDFPKVARDTIREVGYTRAKWGFDYKTCAVISSIDEQSADIAMGVDPGGAGDQGLMFGYACRETRELMPLPIMTAHKLVRRLAQQRKEGELEYLRPDGKSQVTIEYHNGEAKRVHTVVISTQHNEEVSIEALRKDVIESVIRPVIPEHLLDSKTIFHVNPTGRFVVGGPQGDCGLTGPRSSSIPMVAWAVTGVAASRARTAPRSTAPHRTWPVTSPRTLSVAGRRKRSRFSWPMPSAWPTRCR